MAPDDHSGARPAGPVVLRIKLRYDDLDAMVQRFAPNVGKSGLFLPTKSIQPVGAEVKFELRLANDTPVLVGLGRVKHVRPPDPANPRAAFGMAIELMRVTREGREVIIRMIERRRALGLADVAIPLPEDIDAARRQDMESAPRADTAGIVREAMAQMASAPMAEQILTARQNTGPFATAKLETAPVPLVKEPAPEPAKAEPAPSKSEPVKAAEPSAIPTRESGRIVRPSSAPFAAPRESGPISRPVIAALAPEAPRARRPRVQELIAQAESGPIAAAPVVLDEHVDLERALARARMLAGGDMDAELANLRESAAAPIEISVEAASAELARQLGGNAISRRDRSARWAPPPASVPTTLLARGTDPENPVVDAPEPSETRDAEPIETREVVEAREAVEVHESPASLEARADEAAVVEPVPAEAAAAVAAAELDAPVEAARAAALADDDDDDDAFGASAPGQSTVIDPEALRAGPEAHRTFAPPGADEIVTEPGEEPAPPAIGEQGPRTTTEPMRSRPGTRPPATLVEDDAELAAFDRALDGAIIRTGVTKAAPPAEDQLDDDEIEELDSMDLVPEDEMPSESTQIGAMPVDPNAFLNHGQPTVPDPLVDQLEAHLAAAEAEADELHGELRAASQPGYAEPYAPQQQGDGEQPYSEQQGYGEQPYNEQQGYGAHDQQSYGEQPYSEQQGYGAHEQQGYGAHEQQGYAEQPHDAQQGYAEQQPYTEQPYNEQQGYAEHAYAEQPYNEQQGYGEHAHDQQPYAEQPYGEPAYAAEQPQEEVSDLDVLAEADADDADLLAAHGEQDASGNAPAAPADEGSFDFASRVPAGEGSFDYAAPAQPPAGEGSFDYASRLDLGDDDHGFSSAAERGYGRGVDMRSPDAEGGYGRGVDMRRQRSYSDGGYEDGPPAYQDARRQPSYAEERAEYDSFDSPSSYTFAEPVPAPPIAQPSILRDAPPDDLDLESALEELDVDLDELGGAPDRGKRPLPGLPAPRTATGPVPTTRTPTGQVPLRTATGQVPPRTPTGQVPVRATGASRTVPPPLPTPDPETERASSRARRTETPARALATAKPAKPKRAATEDDGVLIDFDDED